MTDQQIRTIASVMDVPGAIEFVLHRLHMESLEALGRELKRDDHSASRVQFLKGVCIGYQEAKRAAREVNKKGTT